MCMNVEFTIFYSIKAVGLIGLFVLFCTLYFMLLCFFYIFLSQFIYSCVLSSVFYFYTINASGASPGETKMW